MSARQIFTRRNLLISDKCRRITAIDGITLRWHSSMYASRDAKLCAILVSEAEMLCHNIVKCVTELRRLAIGLLREVRIYF